MIAGFLGAGGGIMTVPAMGGLLHIEQHKVHGTSLAFIIPISALSTIVHT